MKRIHDSELRQYYSGMDRNRYDYDATYSYDQEWGFYGLHWHDFYELYIHYSGAKFYSIDDRVYPIEPCQLTVVPPLCMHGLIGDSVPRDYERVFLYITPAMLRTCGAGEIDLEAFFKKYTDNGQHHFPMNPGDAQRCKELILQIIEGFHDVSPAGRFANYTRVLSYLQILCDTIRRAPDAKEPVVVNEEMQGILSYINEHFTQPLKLDSLARRFNVSTSFLSHEFVKYTGRSVYDYILCRRVLLAKTMIPSAQTMSDVAYQCGFNDYSSFLRAFRRVTGLSPNEYRRMNREAPSME